jgi:hypothetical protein
MTTSELQRRAFDVITAAATDAGLLEPAESKQITALVDDATPFAEAVSVAESVHVHIRVRDVRQLPDEIADWGSVASRRYFGYVKHAYAGGINLIFSSNPVAEDDLLAETADRRTPYVDHIGIDLRDLDKATSAYDGVPIAALEHDWRIVGQPGPVYGCNAEVDDKLWAYPPSGDDSCSRPIEFALGPLRLYDSWVGCSLRPIDPAHPKAADVSSSASPGPCSCD